MVSKSDILLNNTSLASAGSGLIAAFVGATAGIGLSTVEALLKHTTNPTIFIVGRDASRLSQLIAQVQPLNAGATLHAIVAEDLSSVRSAQQAAEQIASRAPHLDLLIESQGFFSFRSTADFTPEGLDRVTAVRFHGRMRMLVTLLPLLRRARSPRFVSVLGAGQEGPLDLSDLAMTKPETYSMSYAMGASGSLTTLFLEHLAKQPGNEHIVFIHLFPGLVAGTSLRTEGSNFLVRWFWDYIAKTVVRIIGHSSGEVGERVLFAATNGRFRRLPPDAVGAAEGTLIQQGSDGVQGSGAYIVAEDTSVVENGGNADLKKLREQGAAAKVYEYTLSEFERIAKL
ncbi:hypothetical protein PV08_11394 [Exophiala spinifera]|uniref:Ketoreductase (KR) domain-containing protein n=1 Tax=Exophiala spinifera TaxID=91928 RepID=A0A0D2AVG1_9EURO|nr:uncharacterized protein PV08_11394 [Exophiala spinifera]KIW10430.1 hypothetical protein PV08_11394 [Exophiala spinifera]